MNIFKRKQKYIAGNEYIVNLEDIKISEEFKKSPPRPEKLRQKYENYYYNRRMDKIIINTDGICVDGYCTYLIAKMLGIHRVKVLVGGLSQDDLMIKL